MPTSRASYDSAVTMTWDMTGPSSDTNLLIGRESTVVDQGTNDYLAVLVGGSFTGPSSGAAAGVIEVYAYGTWDDGTTYTSDMTGTDGALTLVAETKQLLQLIAVITTNTTNGEIYKWGPFNIASAFGGVVPERWGLWGVHDAGGALQASTTKYTGVLHVSS